MLGFSDRVSAGWSCSYLVFVYHGQYCVVLGDLGQSGVILDGLGVVSCSHRQSWVSSGSLGWVLSGGCGRSHTVSLFAKFIRHLKRFQFLNELGIVLNSNSQEMMLSETVPQLCALDQPIARWCLQ